ncbi:MAG: hypothetical protein AB1861_23895 [Cyanobacteriota bacterium]
MQPQTDSGSTASTTTFKLAIVILIKEKNTGWALCRSGPESDIKEERRQMSERFE